MARALSPIVLGAAAVASASSAQAQTLCVPTPGLGTVCIPPQTPAPLPLLPGPISVLGPIAATINDGAQIATTLDLASIGADADVALTMLGTAAVNTVDEPGAAIDSAGAITAQVTTITTAGDGATGALLRAVDGVLFTADDLISTVGDDAPGLDIEGSTVSVDGNLIRTEGDGSNGVQLVSLDGPINLDADAIETNGDSSTAALLRSSGATNVRVGVLQTQGSQALGLDIGTDPATCVLLGNGGCDVTAAADQITTNGFGGIGALVSAATGVTTIDVDVLQTGGDEAAGLNLSADPVVCATLGAGACDQSFTVGTLTTQGARSPGALVRAAGNVTGNVNVLTTNGDDAVGLDLASDPEACVLLGTGNCGTSFNVGQLTTSGAGATGVLARVVGPTTGRVGLLGTSGDDATGIDIAGDPQACVLLGNGACDVDLAADQVTTRGDGAAGVLIDVPANVLADIGRITTLGDNATGLGITTDPALCVVLGPGACGIQATAGPVDTSGNGSTGVDVDGGGDPVDLTTGPVTTGGDDSPGVDVTNDGPTTVTTGPVATGGDRSPGVTVDGGDGPTTVTTAPIVTAGDNSPGVNVTGTGPITLTADDVTTTGNGSGGIGVAGGAEPVRVSFGDVSTSGADAPGVTVSGTGPITVDGDSVTTRGARSRGLFVGGGSGPVAVTVGSVTTAGADADGIVVATTTGAQTILAGPVAVSGAGADGILATGSGCSAVSVTATGPVTSAQGTGISAASACSVSVTTRAAAPVTGQAAGIAVTSGMGSTVTIGDRVASAGGAAIDANGAGALVTVAQTGTVAGRIDLTDADDRLVNNGLIEAVGDSAFGGGNDSLVNAGTLALRPLGAQARRVAFTGLENTTNSGLIDLRNGQAGDTLALSGNFVGAGDSTLALDVTTGPAGARADSLTIAGAATGSTAILVNPLATGAGVLVNGLVLVDAGAGSSPTAFRLNGVPTQVGLVGYGLGFDPTSATYALYGTPSGQAYELLKASEGARQIFYRTNDAWSGHMRSLRLAAGGTDDTPSRGSALWGQIFGSVDKSRSRQDVTVFGQTQTVVLDNKQDFYGGQLGYDFGGIDARRGAVFGITGGYASSTLGFRGSADRFEYDAANVGAYAGFAAGPLFVNLLGKYEHYWARAVLPGAGLRQSFDGNSWGGKAEAGLRLGSDRFYAEPSVAIEYARTDLDRIDVAPTVIDFDRAEGLRGSAGLVLGSVLTSGPTRTSLYVGGSVVHEFDGEAGLNFANGGQSLDFGNTRIGTYGRGTIGVNVASGSRVSGFIEAVGDWGDDYKGGGGRAGINIRF